MLLLAGLGVRLVALNLPGHPGDSIVMSRWAEHMAEFGPWGFYQHDGAVYPALLYAYWPLGVLFNGHDLARAIKGLSIPFDLALGILVYFGARQIVGSLRALIAPAVYLLNPAVLLAGPVWGQVDAVGTLAYLGALLAAASGRFRIAGALTMLATLIKPQFGLVALPVGVLTVIAWRAAGKAAPIINAFLGGVIMYLVVAIPLRMDPISYIGRALSVASDKPWTSANAPNIWGVLIGYKIPDAPYVLIGGGLFLGGLYAALLPLRWRRDLSIVLAVGLFVVFAFYFLPTRVHERYLFPAMALLAALAATNWRVLLTTLVFAAAFALTIIYGLVSTTPFTIRPDLEAILLSRTAVVWIGLTLMATAATIVVLLLERPRRSSRGRR